MLPIFKKVNPIRFLKNLYFTQNEPVSLVHFVTNRCNARCSFCFIDFDDDNIFNNELSIQEIEKFTKMAKDYWNPRGKYRPLHLFNPARIAFIKDKLISHFTLNSNSEKPLSELKIFPNHEFQ